MTPGLIDFSSKARAPWQGWVLLAAGLLALTTGVVVDRRWKTELNERVDVLERASRDADARLQAVARDRVTRPNVDARRRGQLQAELSFPWLPALLAVESATVDPVYLLGMTLQRDAGLIKLDADVPNLNDALVFVEKLGQTQALASAQLLSQQQVVDPLTNTTSLRFVVSASLGPSRTDTSQKMVNQP